MEELTNQGDRIRSGGHNLCNHQHEDSERKQNCDAWKQTQDTRREKSSQGQKKKGNAPGQGPRTDSEIQQKQLFICHPMTPHPGWSSPPSLQAAGRPAESWRRAARRGWADWGRKTRSAFVGSPQRWRRDKAPCSSHRKPHGDLRGPLKKTHRKAIGDIKWHHQGIDWCCCNLFNRLQKAQRAGHETCGSPWTCWCYFSER